MTAILLLFLLGVLLSAFFSGCETGFYRVTRVRLCLDAISGDRTARGLIWLANNPALFVATTLIGNNLANYLTSLAVVLAATRLWPGHQEAVDALAPLLLAPFIFVYGELLPKNLFYQAPNRLLRLGGPLFLACSILFLPASGVLWLLGRVLRFVVGASPERLQLSLARQELQRVFQEGHDVGLLRPAQRHIAQGMLSLTNEPLTRYCIPIARIASVRLGTEKTEIERIVRRNRIPMLLVTERRGRRVLGYVRLIDLKQDESSTLDRYRDLLTVAREESPVAALVRLQTESEPWARVIDHQQRTVGLLLADRLVQAFLAESTGTAL